MAVDISVESNKTAVQNIAARNALTIKSGRRVLGKYAYLYIYIHI